MRQSAAELLARVESNVFSWTWDLDEQARLAAVQQVRSWLTEEQGDPAQLEIASDPIRWRRYLLPR